MAYTNNQKKQHIAELQKYLHAISYQNERIPTVIPDGFYDNQTANAVRAFQREYNLPETGNTDYATWNKIVSVYKKMLQANPVPYDIFPSSKYIMHKGDSGLLVYILEAMLDDIGAQFDNMPRLNVDGVYGNDTANAVSYFQKKVGLPSNGTVDSGTWNFLVKTSEHINKTIPEK